jgi:hypothetical protein
MTDIEIVIGQLAPLLLNSSGELFPIAYHLAGTAGEDVGRG